LKANPQSFLSPHRPIGIQQLQHLSFFILDIKKNI
jgi:hypothetical protein